MNTQSLATPSAPPLFRGFPYLATRIVAGLHHIIPLPLSEAFDFSRLHEIARIQARLNQLPSCLVLNGEACLYIKPEGYEQPSNNIPSAPYIEWGKLLASEVFPETDELVCRWEMLQRFAGQLHAHHGNGYSLILGDLTKGGRSLRVGEEVSLQGVQADGVAKGLDRCPKCREFRGECIDPQSSLVVRVHCECENDNLCAACLTPLYERKLNSNYFSESDGRIWHIPGFVAFDHHCPQVISTCSAPRIA